MCFYKTNIINKLDNNYSLGKNSNMKISCGHIGFHECLNKYGKIYADPTFIVRNIEK